MAIVNVSSINWTSFGGSNLIASFSPSLPNVEYDIVPSGAYGTLGNVTADGVIVDNLTGVSAVTVKINGVLNTACPPFSRRLYNLPVNAQTFSTLATFTTYGLIFWKGQAPLGPDTDDYDSTLSALKNWEDYEFNLNSGIRINATITSIVPVNVVDTVPLNVNISGVTRKATYDTCSTISAITAGGDIFVLRGSNSKIIKLTRLELIMVQTAPAPISASLVKRSTAPTGGVTAAFDTGAPLPRDNSNGAATATITAYTTPPTPGTLTGIPKRGFMGAGSAPFGGTTAVVFPIPAVFQSITDQEQEQEWTLHSNNEFLCVNIGSPGAGNVILLSATHTEE